MVFAPGSEMVGRRLVYGATLGIAVIFIIPCAVAKNIGTLIVCRAIDGIAFSAPMTLVGGTLADLWKNEERGVPMAAFSAAPFLGEFMENLKISIFRFGRLTCWHFRSCDWSVGRWLPW